MYGHCYGLNVCVPQNAHVEMLTPKVMALGDGALGHEGGAFKGGIMPLQESSHSSPSTMG